MLPDQVLEERHGPPHRGSDSCRADHIDPDGELALATFLGGRAHQHAHGRLAGGVRRRAGGGPDPGGGADHDDRAPRVAHGPDAVLDR